jgi:hypothetical protein
VELRREEREFGLKQVRGGAAGTGSREGTGEVGGREGALRGLIWSEEPSREPGFEKKGPRLGGRGLGPRKRERRR